MAVEGLEWDGPGVLRSAPPHHPAGLGGTHAGVIFCSCPRVTLLYTEPTSLPEVIILRAARIWG